MLLLGLRCFRCRECFGVGGQCKAVRGVAVIAAEFGCAGGKAAFVKRLGALIFCCGAGGAFMAFCIIRGGIIALVSRGTFIVWVLVPAGTCDTFGTFVF